MRVSIIIFLVAVLIGCKPKDSDIKQAIAVNAKEQLAFAGINYTINQQTVTLSGNCPGEELKNKMIKQVKSSPGVKEVIDHIIIAPVVLDNDFVLKQKVDSVLAKYANVQSQVKGGVAILTGTIKQNELDKLMKAMNGLPVNGIDNQLTVQ